MAGHPPTDQPAADTAKVMKAISPCQATLTTKIKEVKRWKSQEIRQDLHKLMDRVRGQSQPGGGRRPALTEQDFLRLYATAIAPTFTKTG